MSAFICPVCGAPLTRREGSLLCPAGHCFDRARQGYVNLALSNKSAAARHGDDAAMVRARQDFLAGGWYAPVRQALLELALPRLGAAARILDAGCGEGYYSAGLADALAARGTAAELLGVDLSRDAVKAAAARRRGMELAVASCAHLPVADGALDMVLNFFSPLEGAEYARVLRAGGTLLRAIPLRRHLWELKAAVYEHPYENDVPDPALPGFRLDETRDVEARLSVAPRTALLALFHMTPYWYKTGREDQRKLEALEALEVTLSVRVLAYTKL